MAGGTGVDDATFGTVAFYAACFGRQQNVSGIAAVRGVMALSAGYFEMFAVIELATNQPAIRNQRRRHVWNAAL